jgi:lipopolysaccharide transport system permease protein
VSQAARSDVRGQRDVATVEPAVVDEALAGEKAVVSEPSAEAKSARVTVIKPVSGWPTLDVGELWHYRELLARLVWRDITVRYKQTSIGVAWAVIQPLMTMIVFTFIFGRFAQAPSKGLHYQIFVYSALLPWTFFASSLSLSSGSLIANSALLSKVYFPRVLLPLAGAVVPAVDFVLASSVLVGLMAWYHVGPGPALVLAPLFLFMAFVTALGVGLFLSAVNVRFRDVPYAIPFVIQIWMFLSGVVYSFDALPQRWQWVLAVNPMTAVINGFQWGVVSTSAPALGQSAVSIASAALFFMVGLWFFRRSEPRFADTI